MNTDQGSGLVFHIMPACTWRLSTSSSELIILHTGGQTMYNYFLATTSASVDLAHHKIFRAKVGKGGTYIK